MNNQIDPIIQAEAKANGLDPDLIRAICAVESNYNQFAIRFEPGWKYFVNPRDWAEKLLITVETETMLQACSWGPAQIMGSVIREFGFQGLLTELTEPNLALEYSCMKLKKLFQRYADEVEVISAWNAGSATKTPGGMFTNQTYVDKVSSRLAALRKI